jgi:hydrogenase maturation protease
LEEIGSDAFTLLEYLLHPEPILIIDCARMGKTPGSVIKISAEDIASYHTEVGISLHGFSLAEIYQLAKSVGTVSKMTIIGVEPKNIEFNTGISKEVEKSIPAIIKMVREEAKKYEA